MQEPTKKHHIDSDMITLQLKVHRKNAAKIEEFARNIEEGGKRTYSLAEVFPDLIGKEKTIALRAYRTREDLTQRELAKKVGIPQRHISEMETGKRVIGKEMAKRFAEVLGVDYRALL
jgi:DNA-binding XRE family transcriptional regulator